MRNQLQIRSVHVGSRPSVQCVHVRPAVPRTVPSVHVRPVRSRSLRPASSRPSVASGPPVRPFRPVRPHVYLDI